MSINKLSKYGIVLVAAVTVATVVQFQFDQSSSKVYADEIASTAPKTSEAPSTTPATSENVSTMPTTQPSVTQTSEAENVVASAETAVATATELVSIAEADVALSTQSLDQANNTVTTAESVSTAADIETGHADTVVDNAAEHSMDLAMISSTQSHDEGVTPATDGKLVGHNLPNTGDTNAKVGILGMTFVGLGLTSLVYKGRHRRSKWISANS